MRTKRTFGVFVSLLIPYVANCAYFDSEPDQRITNGMDAPEGRFPFLVSVQQNGDHSCGGSIISERLILTAAHCCYDLSMDEPYKPEDLTVSVGNLFWKMGKRYSVTKIVVHEDFSLDAAGDDVAILVLDEPMVFSKNVQPIEINPDPIPDTPPLIGLTAGWGYRMIKGRIDQSTEHQLQYVEVKTIPLEGCRERLKNSTSFYVDEVYICVFTGEGKGTCNADSGAPLIYDDQIIGILSLGLDCNNTLPEFYTRVADYNSWIEDIQEQNGD